MQYEDWFVLVGGGESLLFDTSEPFCYIGQQKKLSFLKLGATRGLGWKIQSFILYRWLLLVFLLETPKTKTNKQTLVGSCKSNNC